MKSNLLKNKCVKCKFKFFYDLCFANLEIDGYFKFPGNFCKDKQKEIKERIDVYIKFNEEGVFEYAK